MKNKNVATLEGVLQKYFNDKDELFNNNGYITNEGELAYARMIELLYDIGEVTERDMNDIVDDLDWIR